MSTSVPVLLILFRRPDATRQVFDAIREAQPPVLFLAADGPRDHRPDDEAKCQQARAVVENVDWDCTVHRDFRDDNLGCGRRPASAIDWVFEHVDRAIILEDDCVPNPSFFRFCEEMLDRYADASHVMHVNGNTFGLDQRRWSDYSYGFGNYPQAWGWATWRRAWKSFDFHMTDWPAFRDAGMVESLDGGVRAAQRRIDKWERVYGTEDPEIWDYQWHFAVSRQSGLAVVPQRNLVSNIGHNEDATHTVNPESERANIARHPLSFPLQHPPYIVSDPRINKVYRQAMLKKSWKVRLVEAARSLIGRG
jgi:FAD/FMN-containing dehydrogenase